MWSSKGRVSRLKQTGLAIVCLAGLSFLAACTVEPLNTSRPDSQLVSDAYNDSTRSLLSSTSVSPVTTRLAQQVRNKLLFEMNGGRLEPGGKYNIKLDISSKTSKLAISSENLEPTAARIAVTAKYQIVETASGKTVATGRRRSLASFDRTSQSFSNERAERDAENRAAHEVARLLRLAIAQTYAGL